MATDAPSLTPAQVVARAATYLERHGVESPRETAEALLMAILRTDRTGLYARTAGLETSTAKAYGRALCQRCTGTPLQHLVGDQPFFGLTVAVEPGVFVPRPETEVLVEAALQSIDALPRPVVVDLGTGTGAIALAVKRRRPEATVYATDLSIDAVELARRNAGRHSLDVHVLLGDLFEPLPEALRGRIHLVVSNPPYVRAEDYASLPNEVRADPYDALVGGTAVHRRIAVEAPGWLRRGGWLAMETGSDQAEEVAAMLRPSFEEVEVLPDLAERDRIVRGHLPAAR